MSGVLHGPGQGEVLEMGPNHLEIKATGAETNGTFFLSETTVQAGFPGPPPHVHERLVDMFYVLEGAVTVLLGEEEHRAGPGTFVCASPGTVHTFRNDGDVPARFLNFNTPSGWEDYMRDLAAAFESGSAATPEDIGKIASKYDFRAV
jgi:mannose-6-phosphate isomerase-like protein (cupin superfamily)